MMQETRRALLWAGGLSLAAALLHSALIAEHLSEWWAYGAFFMLAMAAQGVYGLAIVGTDVMEGRPIHEHWAPRTRRAFYLAGAIGNALLVGMYVLSRTVGVPAGPEKGEVEAVTAFGVVTKLVELVLLALLLLLWRASAHQRTLRG